MPDPLRIRILGALALGFPLTVAQLALLLSRCESVIRRSIQRLLDERLITVRGLANHHRQGGRARLWGLATKKSPGEGRPLPGLVIPSPKGLG